MKRLVLALATLALSACAAQESSDVNGFPGFQVRPSKDYSGYKARAVQGTLLSVVHKATSGAPGSNPPALGLTVTEINLGFEVPCTDELAMVSSVADDAGDELTLHVAATLLAKQPKAGEFVCQSIAQETRTITLNKYVAEDKLAVEFLQGNETDVMADLIGVTPAAQIELKSLTPMCPEGVQCVTNGTTITLDILTSGCMDKLGPVAYEVQPNGDGKAILWVSASRLESKSSLAALCPAMSRAEYRFSLPMQFYDQIEIRSAQ